MVTMPVLDSWVSSLSGLFGFGLYSLLMGLLLLVVCLSYFDMDFLYAFAVGGIPFMIYIINLGNNFYWLLGGMIIVYGVLAFTGIRKLLGNI